MDAPQTLASVVDLAGFIGEAITDEADVKRAEWCLRVASGLVRSETGKQWLSESGELVSDLPDTVSLVTIYCASRIYDNREARTTAGVDDFREGWKVDEAGAYLTLSERRQLSDHSAGRGSGIGTITRTKAEAPSANGWAPTGTPDVEFPWY